MCSVVAGTVHKESPHLPPSFSSSFSSSSIPPPSPPPHPPCPHSLLLPLLILLLFLLRSVSLTAVKLLPQAQFSLPLITPHLSPSTLLNIAHLAGFLDHRHSLRSILQQAHSLTSSFPLAITKSLGYHQLCNSVLQMAATKSLHSILFDESVLKLLSYQPPPMHVVISGTYVDKSELADSVKEVLKCLATRAVKPSPLKPSLRLMELERVHAVLGYECLAAVAECKENFPFYGRTE